MAVNNVVVTVLDEPANGVVLQVEGPTLRDVSITSRDNWDELLTKLDSETRKLIVALYPFTGISRVDIRHNIITIRNDCDRSRIEDAVASAFGAELVEFIPPRPIPVRDRQNRRGFLIGRR